MSIEKELIPYAEAIALKQLGFDEPCLSYYEGESFSYHLATITSGDNYIIPAPLFQQAFRWFREKHNKLGCIKKAIDRNRFIYLIDDIVFGFYDTYEEAELACLRKLIEIVQGGNK